MHPIFIASLVALGIYYVPTIIGLLRMQFKFVSIYPTDISEDTIQVAYTMDCYNDSAFDVRLNKVDASLALDDKNMGVIQNSFNVLIEAKKVHRILIYIQVNKKSVSEDVWFNFINMTLANSTLKIKGKITANNKELPFEKSMKLAELWQE